jgi:hypothetical protein
LSLGAISSRQDVERIARHPDRERKAYADHVEEGFLRACLAAASIALRMTGNQELSYGFA